MANQHRTPVLQNLKSLCSLSVSTTLPERRRLLDYVKAKDIERYRAIIKELGIRK